MTTKAPFCGAGKPHFPCDPSKKTAFPEREGSLFQFSMPVQIYISIFARIRGSGSSISGSMPSRRSSSAMARI